jgi:hypothetical protein
MGAGNEREGNEPRDLRSEPLFTGADERLRANPKAFCPEKMLIWPLIIFLGSKEIIKHDDHHI